MSNGKLSFDSIEEFCGCENCVLVDNVEEYVGYDSKIQMRDFLSLFLTIKGDIYNNQPFSFTPAYSPYPCL